MRALEALARDGVILPRQGAETPAKEEAGCSPCSARISPERQGRAFVDLMPIALLASGSMLSLAVFPTALVSLGLPLHWPGRVCFLCSSS
ncbi:MAG: hypothetical protein CSA62_01285 [Planctomycetota bacterium]|nr:MAG: hypothetical protein CSA62_01285 [Planctomycetota bacterium]